MTTLTNIRMNLSSDDLRPRLLIHEQSLKLLRVYDEGISDHPVLVTKQSGGSNASSNRHQQRSGHRGGWRDNTNGDSDGGWCNNRNNGGDGKNSNPGIKGVWGFNLYRS